MKYSKRSRKFTPLNSTRTLLGIAGIFFSLSPAAAWGQASFQGLGDLPGGVFKSEARGVSADGTVVVGSSTNTSGTQAVRWTVGGGMIDLGNIPGGIFFFSEALATSADGSVIVGDVMAASGFEAFRWTAGSGMVGLGDLPDGSFSSMAFATSADGSVVVGQGRSALGGEAFRWTQAGGMVALGDLPGGTFNSGANAVSADGTVVAGRGRSALGGEAFRWTQAGGMVALGDLLGGTFSSSANATSADGTVVAGRGRSTFRPEAFRWTQAGGMVGLGDTTTSALAMSADGTVIVGVSPDPGGFNEAFRWTADGGAVGLGDLPGSVFRSEAFATSADGSVIVGTSESTLGLEASVWTAGGGMRSLRDLLTINFGLDLTGWELDRATGISADGRTIVGMGTNPNGDIEGWIATVVPTCGDGILDAGEACDDGNTNNDSDSCLSNCEINPNPIPTVSQWGLVAMALFVLIAGTLVRRYRMSSLDL